MAYDKEFTIDYSAITICNREAFAACAKDMVHLGFGN